MFRSTTEWQAGSLPQRDIWLACVCEGANKLPHCVAQLPRAALHYVPVSRD